MTNGMNETLTLKQKENMNKPIIKMALMMLDNIRTQLIEGGCDETDIQDVMTKFHPSVNEKFINKDDYINADKAMSILHLGSNRAKFFELIKAYGIESHKLNNMPIGYKKSEIIAMAQDLKEEVKEREKKEKKRKGQRKFLW